MNERYFERYPDDRARVREIHRRLDAETFLLDSGDRLTARRFRQLGMWLGDGAGWELLHHVLELPMDSQAFRRDVENGAAHFERNPLYATLHESSYADGVATRWSADRLLPDEIRDGVAFTAEHVFPWMFEDYGGARPHAAAAEILAQHEWPRLFDAARLAVNEVPVAATIYVDDLYVERAFAEETAAAIRGLRPWITNEYVHNGLARRRRARPRPADRPRARARLRVPSGTAPCASVAARLRCGHPEPPTYGARPRPPSWWQDAWAHDGPLGAEVSPWPP